jgi:hypothetical protein
MKVRPNSVAGCYEKAALFEPKEVAAGIRTISPATCGYAAQV